MIDTYEQLISNRDLLVIFNDKRLIIKNLSDNVLAYIFKYEIIYHVKDNTLAFFTLKTNKKEAIIQFLNQTKVLFL